MAIFSFSKTVTVGSQLASKVSQRLMLPTFGRAGLMEFINDVNLEYRVNLQQKDLPAAEPAALLVPG
jgi:hypothetical protein